MGAFYFSIYWRGVYSSGINNNFMVSAWFYEVWWSGKFYTFINMEYEALLAMVAVEMNKCLDKLKWRTIWSSGISKEVDGVSGNNGEGWDKFSAGYLVEETKFKMKVSTRI